MIYLKDKNLNGNRLNCSIKIEEKVISIHNFNIEDKVYKDKDFLIFFKKENDNDIYYYYKKIFKIYYSKKYNNSFNLKHLLEKSKYIQIINQESNSDIIFINTFSTDFLNKNRKQWIYFMKNIEHMCHKKKLYNLIYKTDYSIKSILIKNGIISKQIDQWDKNKLLICKPENGACGKDIFIKPYKDMLEYIQTEKIHNFILQEYIESKLVRGKKFDLRIYVFLNSNGDFFISEHGFLRLAQKKYNSKKTDISIHLTNTSIAKNKAEIISFHSWDEKNKYLEKIKIVIEDVIQKFNKKYTESKDIKSFHLLGFDLMIDKKDRIRVIEINKRPSMKFINNLSKSIKQKMVYDLVKFFHQSLH